MVPGRQTFSNLLSYLSQQDVKKPAQSFVFPKHMYQQLFIISRFLLLKILIYDFSSILIMAELMNLGLIFFRSTVIHSSVLGSTPVVL